LIRLGSVVLALCLLLLSSHAQAEFAGELVPSYSGYYDDLKLLATKGSVPAGLINMRPLTRGQIAAVLAEGMRENPSRLLADPVGRRLVREFSREIESLGIRATVHRHEPFRRIEMLPAEPRAGGEAETGSDESGSACREPAAVLELSPYAWVRVDNVEPLYFEALEDRRVGLEATLSAGSGAMLVHADLVVGNHSKEPRGIPEFGTLNALVEGEDINSWMHRAYLLARTRALDASLGRDWIRWGPGRTGVLGAGDAVSALNIFMLRKRMTNVDLATYAAMLDFTDEQMVAGHRVEFRPTPRLTLGFAEQARFTTIQQAPLYAFAFYPYSIVEKLVGADSEFEDKSYKNNVMWTVDFDWIPAANTRIYGEFLLDDWSFSRDKKPGQIGYQAGISRTRALGVEALSIRAEFTKIHGYTYTQARRSVDVEGEDSLEELDFEHNGLSLGHPLGPDSEGYHLGLRYDASVRSKWDFSWETRRLGELELGEGWVYGDPVPETFPLSGVVETSTRIMAQYTFYPEKWSGSWASLGGGLRKVGNADNREGNDKDWDGIMKASVALQW